MKKANRLEFETSPYLKQHAHNPVDWYPWGKEALERAQRENKPIFLSIGYSACHWCHVMEKESFEDEETAKLLNLHFINIKVDREERPDLDHIYMSAVQLLTQHGGWPMSVFLTPHLQPFYGGTYFPPQDRMGLPSFKRVILGVSNAWKTRNEEVLGSAKQLTEALHSFNQGLGQAGTLRADLISKAPQSLQASFDPTHGGFGSQPKFFHTMDLRVCLRAWKRSADTAALNIVTTTLDNLARGGIYDHLGGGFHRYSTDRQWLVPHFEKMLYDNALLSQTYLEAYQALKNPLYAQVAREIFDYVLREMTSPEGGFFSTQDADTEGEEGKFYVWSKKEVMNLLGDDLGALFCQVYQISEAGNWEGSNILHLKATLEQMAKELKEDFGWLEDSLAAGRRKLLQARAKRIAPHRDEKILTSWNGLMIESFAYGYQTLDDERYLKAAQTAAEFLLEKMGTGPEGKSPLLHSFKDGDARFNGYLDDYGCLINALVTLYEADFNPKWIKAAKGLAATLIDQFWDAAGKTFYYTGKGHETLITRPKELLDGATPSGFAMAVTGLIRLGYLCEDMKLLDISEQALSGVSAWMEKAPQAAGQSLIALGLLIDGARQMVIAVPDKESAREALSLVRSRFIPNKVVACAMPGYTGHEEVKLANGKGVVAGKPTLYLCQNFSCKTPVAGLQEMEEALDG